MDVSINVSARQEHHEGTVRMRLVERARRASVAPGMQRHQTVAGLANPTFVDSRSVTEVSEQA